MANSVKVKEVYPAEDLHLIVIFENGKVKDYDVKQLFEQFPDYKALRNPDLFNLVHVDCGGYAVAWNDELDISECELWEGSVDYSSPFDGLMSFSDAAQKWGLDDSTLRKAAASSKLINGVDIRKFGKQWITTESSMKRIFGEPM